MRWGFFLAPLCFPDISGGSMTVSNPQNLSWTSQRVKRSSPMSCEISLGLRMMENVASSRYADRVASSWGRRWSSSPTVNGNSSWTTSRKRLDNLSCDLFLRGISRSQNVNGSPGVKIDLKLNFFTFSITLCKSAMRCRRYRMVGRVRRRVQRRSNWVHLQRLYHNVRRTWKFHAKGFHGAARRPRPHPPEWEFFTSTNLKNGRVDLKMSPFNSVWTVHLRSAFCLSVKEKK